MDEYSLVILESSSIEGFKCFYCKIRDTLIIRQQMIKKFTVKFSLESGLLSNSSKQLKKINSNSVNLIAYI